MSTVPAPLHRPWVLPGDPKQSRDPGVDCAHTCMHVCTHLHNAAPLAHMIAPTQVGQLGGGVSVCLRSLADLDWGKGWASFAEVVGRALWGRFFTLVFF